MYATMPANQVFQRILNRKITDDKLRRSRYYEKYCRERIFDLKHMPGILNKNARVIFPFDKVKAGSVIRGQERAHVIAIVVVPYGGRHARRC